MNEELEELTSRDAQLAARAAMAAVHIVEAQQIIDDNREIMRRHALERSKIQGRIEVLSRTAEAKEAK